MTTNAPYPAKLPWVTFPRPNPAALLRIFCFPYAGGSASAFYSWPRDLAVDAEICAIQLPGRETRISEKPYSRLLPLVRALLNSIWPLLDRPFVFFGHSMGAILAFEVTRELRALQGGSPLHLFVSGSRAPHMPPREPTHNLPEDELVDVLRRLNGVPEEILNDLLWRKAYFPLLRADLEIDETYEYKHEPALDVPITAFGGVDDTEVTSEELEAWRVQTHSRFQLQHFPGDHFFLRTEQKQLLRAVSEALTCNTMVLENKSPSRRLEPSLVARTPVLEG